MNLLLEVIATVVAFVTIMLAVSLVVSLLVRLIHYLARTRSQTLAEMLGALNLGFRREYGDRVQPGDDAQQAFVIAILSDPTLHTSSRLRAADLASSRSLSERNLERFQRTTQRLLDAVEYIAQEDLVAIAKKHAVVDELPIEWTGAGTQAARSFTNFTGYVARWFRTAEGVSSEQFKRDSMRLVLMFSAMLVVLLNLDGLALIQTIRLDAALRTSIGLQAPDLLDAANRFDPAKVGETAPPIERNDWLNVDLPAQQINTLVSDPSLGLGWQRSGIVRLVCSYRDDCSKIHRPGQPTISTLHFIFGVVFWLVGLGFSWGMLSLGAPFWADRLSELLKLRDAVERYLGKTLPTGRPQ